MIIKGLDNGKFVVWNGFGHYVLSEEFDTIEEAEEKLKEFEKDDS